MRAENGIAKNMFRRCRSVAYVGEEEAELSESGSCCFGRRA